MVSVIRGDDNFDTAIPTTPTSAQVGTATAGLDYNSVGSYGLFWWSAATQRAPGATVSGSSLYPTNLFVYVNNAGYTSVYGQPSGTWKLLMEQTLLTETICMHHFL